MYFPYKQMIAAVAMSGIAGLALAQSVSFLEPADGATVASPFKVRFAVNGMEVKPAGEMAANTGHHHLLINADSVKAGESVPFDDQHLHFGKGQTETDVKLAPGVYVLTMQFANGSHQSYGTPMSKSIKVTVK
ncbi:MAG: rod shape-determining protein RodA [Massilia sp.]|nr:rod shape-determining protein RodA [Massilia sp.]